MNYDDHMQYGYFTGPKITVIGGGTGLSVILRGMKNVTSNLTAVVTVADDGGGSGVLREDLGMLPPGDIRSCILALADDEGPMQDVLKYRFLEGRMAGQNVGNILIAALNGIYGNFEEAVSQAGKILRIKGQVLPVSTDDITLCAELENGGVVCGESMIEPAVLSQNSPIKRVFLKPENAVATKRAINAILEADIIVLGPGSLYSSIIANFLVGGISDALRCSFAKKILICNMMSQPGETDGYTVRRHIEEVNRYIGKDVVEYAIANNRKFKEEILKPYIEDGAVQILPQEEDKAYCREKGIRLIQHDFADVRMGYIRHDADRIANVVVGLALDYV